MFTIYYKWFNFTDYPEKYESWWGIEILPKLNPHNESCRRYFTGDDGIIQKYIKRGIAGWRLDVADELSDEFLDECLESIGTGLGYPAIMNDDVNIAALKRYGYRDEDVYDYSMVGCIENFITGKQPPWSDGRFDTPRFFDYVLNHGRSTVSRSFGPDLCDLSEIDSMDAFMKVFERVLAYGASEYWARFNHKNDSIHQAHYPEPFLSCFCEDCIGRGLDINNGGAVYPFVNLQSASSRHRLQSYGLI